MNKMQKILLAVVLLCLFVGMGFLYSWNAIKHTSTSTMIAESIAAVEKISRLFPIAPDTKKELEVTSKLTEAFTRADNVERTYLVLLQNNQELRPGGGFLGQYAVVKVKNGEVTSLFIEDANLLDQRITARVTPPSPLRRMMNIKRWKFRDSNFSPDFPTNVEKAKYFYRLAGRPTTFDGVIAVNADVLSEVLKLTGPITVPGFPGEYTSENAVLKLEEQVEKGFETQGINVQDRKMILKSMGKIIVERLATLRNLPKLAEFMQAQFQNKNVMVWLNDPALEQLVSSVHWDGSVAKDWNGDYLLVVDANLGALKSDYYVKRSLVYEVDLTGEKPKATVEIAYKHTATHGDWRTSDYHSYLRVYAPQGSTLTDRYMVSYPVVGEDFGKTVFGATLHALMNRTTTARISYDLPVSVRDNYRLLVQKQSGVGDIPLLVRIRTDKGVFEQSDTLKKDLRFEFEQ